MPLRRTSDGRGAVYYTAICDHCLRIGPTHSRIQLALNEGRFRWADTTVVSPDDQGQRIRHHAIRCIDPCEINRPEPDALAEALAREIPVVVPEETPCCPTLRVVAPTACPSCSYSGKSRWDRLREAVPYDPDKPCPKCDHQWQLPRIWGAPQGIRTDVVGTEPDRAHAMIRSFQQAYGLVADGIVGEATRRQLIGSRWMTRQAHAVAVVQEVSGEQVTMNTGLNSYRFQLENLFQLFDLLGPEQELPAPAELRHPAVNEVWAPRAGGPYVVVVQAEGGVVMLRTCEGLRQMALAEFHMAHTLV